MINKSDLTDVTWVLSEHGEFPSFYSDSACRIIADKYFKNGENSWWQVVSRVAWTIAQGGWDNGYFDDEGEKVKFARDLVRGMVRQHFAFNSPVYFNLGIEEHPQCSACFIQGVEDSMESILDLAKKEGSLFKHGSGTGTNFSSLRAKGEALSKGGTSSGPMDFIHMLDQAAGVIKSGGKNRRSAKMIIMEHDHHDIYEFITSKAKEERLIADGLPQDRAKYQNGNHTVRVTDEFMHNATDRAGYKNAKDLLRSMAEAAWVCGDPGIQFTDTINSAMPEDLKCHASNPCQPGTATVLTPKGIRTFDEIQVGSTIWSGKQWTKVINKEATGEKHVRSYRTSVGNFLGTENHRVVSHGEKIEVQDAVTIDICTGPEARVCVADLLGQDIIDGWVLGDGGVHQASGNLVGLYLGEDDVDAFTYPKTHRPGVKDTFYEVNTTITAKELPMTYDRLVPDRFYHGNQQKAAGFLRGLYAANGSVCGGRVTLKASSFGVIDQVREMLSALGIRSYVTTNLAHDVTFPNGTYTCKESYDLNITADKRKFETIIGFVHPHKARKLRDAKAGKAKKQSYEIHSVESYGMMNVYDITVDAPEHTYWTDGHLVSNCGEFMFINESACNLASINLCKVLPTSQAFVDVVALLVTAMDILVEISSYPSREIEKNSRDYRPIGLGYSNLGKYLMDCGLPYGGVGACEETANLTERMNYAAMVQSMQLAKRLGAYRGSKQGLRNAQLTLLAPTGTISFAMDCESTGIEPVFAEESHKTLVGGGTIVSVPKCITEAEARKDYGAIKVAISTDKDRCVTPEEHLNMMEAAQPYLSGAISKTVNMPADCTVEDILQIYVDAWKMGLKGIAVYRDGSKGQQPLTTKPEPKFEAQEYKKAVTVDGDRVERMMDLLFGQPKAEKLPHSDTNRKPLPATRQSVTHKFTLGGMTGYATIGLYEDGSPGEMFLQMSKAGSAISGWADSWSTLFSIALQSGMPLKKLVNKFKGTKFEPSGVSSNEDIRLASSVLDYLMKYLELHYLKDGTNELPNTSPSGEFCECGSMMVRTGSCYSCPSCGLSGGCG